MNSRDANAFVRRVRGWFKPELRHECYDEGCKFEEVSETISNKKQAVGFIRQMTLLFLLTAVRKLDYFAPFSTFSKAII